MKLFRLQRSGIVGYGQLRTLVVRAKDETRARELFQEHSCSTTQLDQKQIACVSVSVSGKEQVICADRDSD